MKCFNIDLNTTPRVSLSSKEHLIPPRGHITRRATTYILYFITEGTLCIMLNGEELTLSKGDIYVFESGDTHAPARLTDCEYFYLHFEANATDMYLSYDEMREAIKARSTAFSSYEILDTRRYEHLFALLPKKIHVDDARTFGELEEAFRSLKLNVWDVGLEKRLELSQGVTSLFLRLERIALGGNTAADTPYSPNFAFVRQIASFVEKNYTSDISSEDIEKRFSLSYDYANRIFKQQRGKSIIAYRNHLRIEKAKLLLLTTEKSMDTISDEIGFGDKYYFSKFFKKTVGVSPTRFKRGEHLAD